MEDVENPARLPPYDSAGLKSYFAQFDSFGPSLMDIKTLANPLLRVNWQLGNFCNYGCSYCSNICHSGSFPWPTIAKAEAIVRKIDQVYKQEPYAKKKIVFELLGGEVTVWQDLDRLLDLIKETDNLCMLVSNGSRNLDWWIKNAGKFGYTTLSFHPEKADYKHVSAVANILADAGVGVGILVLMYPPRWDYCLEARQYFVANSRAHTVATQPLTLIPDSTAAQNGTADTNGRWPYTVGQQAWLKRTLTYHSKVPFKDSEWLNVGLKYFNRGEEKRWKNVEAAYLSAHGLNNWKDWDCFVGIDTLYVEQNGHVRRDAMCRVASHLGNWRKDDGLETIEWPKEPVKCPFTACLCAHDFRARRNKI